MIFRIDYHMHPNLPRDEHRAEQRCREWWHELKQHRIDGVIVAEHIYKDPQRAYDMMRRTCPKDRYAFPGLEYLTKEGVDVVVFSDSPRIYGYSELSPYQLTVGDTIRFIKHQKLQGYIPHPYTIGKTSLRKILGEDRFRHYVDQLQAVEVSNTSLSNLYNLFMTAPSICAGRIEDIRKVRHLPEQDYPKAARFFAAGSDAHFPEEVGTCMRLESDRDSLYNDMISNRKMDVYIRQCEDINIPLLVKSGVTAFKEFMTKQRIKLCQKP